MKKYFLGFIKGLGIVVAYFALVLVFQEVIKQELPGTTLYLFGLIVCGFYWIKYMPKNTPKAYMILALLLSMFSLPFFSGYREWAIKNK